MDSLAKPEDEENDTIRNTYKDRVHPPVQYFQEVMSQKFIFYNTKYAEMRHLGATLLFGNAVSSFTPIYAEI